MCDQLCPSSLLPWFPCPAHDAQRCGHHSSPDLLLLFPFPLPTVVPDVLPAWEQQQEQCPQLGLHGSPQVPSGTAPAWGAQPGFGVMLVLGAW